jgi:metal-responsive CopG/Arc/MetJ family transcriptional regulator
MPSVKTAVSLPESVFKQVEALAEELRVSRSRLLLMAIEQFTERRRNKELFEALSRAYTEPPTSEERRLLRAAKRYHRLRDKEEW